METKSIPQEMKTTGMTKMRAGVTFLVFAAVWTVAILTLTVETAKAMPQPNASSFAANLNSVQAQAIVNQVYTETRDQHLDTSFETAGPHDRVEHLCVDQCACISRHFTSALRRSGFVTRTVRLRPAKNAVGIRITGAKSEYGMIKTPSFDYHVASIVRLKGGWRVVDPVGTSSLQLEPLSQWRNRVTTPVEIDIH